MRVKNIKITNFKSIYETQEFDFENLSGLIKLQGNVGAGKTTLGEAIHFGLFGNVKNINNSDLVSWGERVATVEIELESKGKNIAIVREIKNNASSASLKVTIDGEDLMFSNKRDAQQVLEEEYYDVTRLSVEQLCIISFENFKPIPQMTAKETRDFLDSIFGLYFLTDYSERAKSKGKEVSSELMRVNANIQATEELIRQAAEANKEPWLYVNENRETFKIAADTQITEEIIKGLIDKCQAVVNDLTAKTTAYKKEANAAQQAIYALTQSAESKKREATSKYNNFKRGLCPTCGQKVDVTPFLGEVEAAQKELESLQPQIDARRREIDQANVRLSSAENNIRRYNNYIYKFKTDLETLKRTKTQNDNMLNKWKRRLEEYKQKSEAVGQDKREWEELGEMLNKSLRFELFSRLIPSINMNTQHFVNQLRLPYTIKFNSDFSCVITPSGMPKQEIKMSSLSTGQRKNFSTAIIFGILKTIIKGINFNIYFLDELFSNMDVDTRDIMLSMLKENVGEDQSMFIINHAEMSDEFFDHVVRVKQHTGEGTTLNPQMNRKYSVYKTVM